MGVMAGWLDAKMHKAITTHFVQAAAAAQKGDHAQSAKHTMAGFALIAMLTERKSPAEEEEKAK